MAESAWPTWNARLVFTPARCRRFAFRAYLLLPVVLVTFFIMFMVSDPFSSSSSFSSTTSSSSPSSPSSHLESFSSSDAPPINMEDLEELPKSPLRINLVDFPLRVRSLLFGIYNDRFPLNSQEEKKEKDWRARIIAFVRTAKYCNQFFGDPDSGAVMRLADFKVKPPKGVSSSEALEAHVMRLLQRDGYNVRVGGTFDPKDCTARETVAVVVPYRDRFENLITFLNYMHRYLQRQRRRYVLVVAEQFNYNASFNRAKLFNAVVREMFNSDGPQIDCFVLHDVDKVPYHLFNLYACGFQPRQIATMAWNNSNGQWVDYYSSFFGGVTAFSRWQLLQMNGVSNSFYGWGAEDDDMYGRAILAGFLPSYPSKYVGRVWVMGHHDDMKKIAKRFEMLWTDRIAERMVYDGLWQAKYVLQKKINRPLYTKFSFIV